MVSGFILCKYYIKNVSRYEFLTADNSWLGSIWVEMCIHEVNVPDSATSHSVYLKDNLHIPIRSYNCCYMNILG
jgi:hypothetical protein